MSYCAIHVTKNMIIIRYMYMSFQQEMRITPTKIWLQAVKKLAVTFYVACHVNKKMTRANHITRQHKTWLHIVTGHVGLIFFLSGQVKERHGLQNQSRHAPRAVGIVDYVLLYAQTIYIHMIVARNVSSVMIRPSHLARHLPSVHRKSYFGVLWLEAVINGNYKW
jgi:hypothetical protein